MHHPDMNWFIHDFTGDNSIKPALLQTDCYEQVTMNQKNVSTDGSRDYSNNYKYGQPDESHWDLPKGITCKKVTPPHDSNSIFATWQW